MTWEPGKALCALGGLDPSLATSLFHSISPPGSLRHETLLGLLPSSRHPQGSHPAGSPLGLVSALLHPSQRLCRSPLSSLPSKALLSGRPVLGSGSSCFLPAHRCTSRPGNFCISTMEARLLNDLSPTSTLPAPPSPLASELCHHNRPTSLPTRSTAQMTPPALSQGSQTNANKSPSPPPHPTNCSLPLARPSGLSR